MSAASLTDAALAAEVAAEAGRLLLAIREEGHQGRALGDEGDRRANALILERLRAARPDDGFLSEESADDRKRLDFRRVWIIDPLDGTREYGEGRSDWAVHVALAIDGRPEVGAVALPALGLTLATDGAYAPIPAQSPPRMVVSRTRAPAEVTAIAGAIGAELIPMGSAGAKAMAVVRGEADIYFHAGGQYEWDNCAPAAVALAAGLHASRADGSPLVYNNADTRVPDLLFCRPELADHLLALIAAAGTAPA
ncbi:3'(2'),5'-bisphosphate nucleotidase CysQ [Sphingomonas canadensis]|uniref:3'(2'),5'-bisphosphate nucleotidase CysQ n=1 Tax=Sphingomonas canadensis TaxID=1219257 RepID=A0ABW3H3A0_9SPHN|nr:3'(2'),5'-bisphosphate nucleotidase CysQ [Sphingomonas canadensis]MCW3835680.1 3'(2'),5'-bisphosphate nucleotidase CysQ [Sphingomonas canadensis]